MHALGFKAEEISRGRQSVLKSTGGKTQPVGDVSTEAGDRNIYRPAFSSGVLLAFLISVFSYHGLPGTVK